MAIVASLGGHSILFAKDLGQKKRASTAILIACCDSSSSQQLAAAAILNYSYKDFNLNFKK